MARIRTVLYGYLPCLILLCACRMVLLWYSSLLFHPSEWLFSRAVSLGEQIPLSLPEPSSCAFLASSMYFFLLASGAITSFQNHVLPSGCLGPLWCILWLQVASAITCLVLLTLSVFFLRVIRYPPPQLITFGQLLCPNLHEWDCLHKVAQNTCASYVGKHGHSHGCALKGAHGQTAISV